MARSTIRGIVSISQLGMNYSRASMGLLTQKDAQPIFKYISKFYRRNKAGIPYDTGALSRSLIRLSDRHNLTIVAPSRSVYGSTLHYAKYQFMRVPRLDRATIDWINHKVADIIWTKTTGKWMGRR